MASVDRITAQMAFCCSSLPTCGPTVSWFRTLNLPRNARWFSSVAMFVVTPGALET